jgi:hypothetical protein
MRIPAKGCEVGAAVTCVNKPPSGSIVVVTLARHDRLLSVKVEPAGRSKLPHMSVNVKFPQSLFSEVKEVVSRLIFSSCASTFEFCAICYGAMGGL